MECKQTIPLALKSHDLFQKNTKKITKNYTEKKTALMTHS